MNDERSRTRRRRRQIFSLLLLTACLVFFAIEIWQQRWMSDDGFINLTVVQNLLDGYGPVFNVGERVEAYTSTLWIAVLSALGALGLRLEYAAVGAGMLLSITGVALAFFGAARLHQRPTTPHPRVLLPLGVLTYISLRPSWDYGTSGLETGLVLTWLGGVFFAATHLTLGKQSQPASWHWYLLSAGLGLGPLIRPELSLFSLALFSVVAWCFAWRETGRFELARLAKLVIALGAIPVAYQIFRMGYFAAIVPNTAVAKEAFAANWVQGERFFSDFFGRYYLAVPLVTLALLWAGAAFPSSRRREWVRLALMVIPTVCGLGYTLYVVKIGGGFMHGRLFLPPLFGMLLPVMAIPIPGMEKAGWTSWTRAAAGILVLGWASYCAASLEPSQDMVDGIVDERSYYVEKADVPNPILLEDFRRVRFHRESRKLVRIGAKFCPGAFQESRPEAPLPRDCAPKVYLGNNTYMEFKEFFPSFSHVPLKARYRRQGTALVVSRMAIGIRSHVLGRRVHLIDQLGLASPISARLAIHDRGRPGHEKELSNPWVVGRFGADQPLEDPRISAARRALSCGDLAELLEAIEGAITLQEFGDNIVDAFRFHRLRIPHDVYRAEWKFCDATPPTRLVEGGPGGGAVDWRCQDGHVLVGMEMTRSAQSDALASVRPRCARLDSHSGRSQPDSVAPAPVFGKASQSSAELLSCSDGMVITGLRGTALRFVEDAKLVCSPLQSPAETDAGEGTERAEDSEFFEVSCPEGEVAVGMAGRTGAVIDAIGLLCEVPRETLESK